MHFGVGLFFTDYSMNPPPRLGRHWKNGASN